MFVQVTKSKVAKKRGKVASKRKAPVQERSQRRLENIVEAAAESFADFGFEATTMEGIAARADTSIGSVYQRFPNKKAVFREVAHRCLAASADTFGRILGPDPMSRPWRELLGVAIDAYREFQLESVYMRAVWRNFELYGEYAAEDLAQLRGFAVTLAALLGVWAPGLDEQRRGSVAATVVNAIAACMLTASRESPEQADALVIEAKVMLTQYLGSYIEPAQG